MELPAELEAAIRAAPDDRAGYSVAGDWLSGHGDPQGELIALSLATPTEDIRSRIAVLQRQLEPVSTSDRWNPMRLEWRWGFVTGVAVASVRDPEEAAMLRAVLRSPVGRFARKLVLVQLASGTLVDVAIAEARGLASLRTLVVECEDGARPDLAPLWEHTPDLERVVLRVDHPIVELALPRLRELSILRPHSAYLTGWVLPCLETLRIRLDATVRIDGSALARFPALRRLTLAGDRVGTPDDWRALAIASRLELFDLISDPQGFDADRRFVIDPQGTALPAALLWMVGPDDPPPGTLVALPDRGSIVIGRSTDAGLVVRSPSVGRRHARVELDVGGWTVDDYGSPNGTRVNGHFVDRCPLRAGDELAFGHVEFRFLAGDVHAQAAELRARFGLGL